MFCYIFIYIDKKKALISGLNAANVFLSLLFVILFLSYISRGYLFGRFTPEWETNIMGLFSSSSILSGVYESISNPTHHVTLYPTLFSYYHPDVLSVILLLITKLQRFDKLYWMLAEHAVFPEDFPLRCGH